MKRSNLWETIDHCEIMDCFPILTEQDIGDITLGNDFTNKIPFITNAYIGVYQLKRARAYVAENYSTANQTQATNYILQRCKIIPNLIRVPTQSAHSNRKVYHPTLQFTTEKLIGWWCDCITGARFIGCCSHICSLIWYLGYERWKSSPTQMRSTSYMTYATDSIQVSDFYDSSDNDDEATSRYSLATSQTYD